MNALQLPSPKMRLMAALGLFFLSPFIGEFLLGNIPITMLWLLPILALLYGSGCIMIREVSIRLNLNWGGMLLLCLVYAIFEEAFNTQSLFDPNYLGLRLLDYGFIPSLGMGSWWSTYVLGIHVIWSTAVPIALIEYLSPQTSKSPFMGNVGLMVVTLLFLLVCFMPILTRNENTFIASNGQMIASAGAIILLTVTTLLFGRHKKITATNNQKSPGAIAVGSVAFLLSSAFMATTFLMQKIPAGVNVAAMIILFTTGCLLCWHWSKQSNWSAKHGLSFISGLILTYGWYGFVQVPSIGGVSPFIDTMGNILFSGIALLLIYLAWRKSSKTHSLE